MYPEETFAIETNIKEDKLVEVLEEWVRAQAGRGNDESQPNRQKTFHIEIELNLADDTFTTKSDTGNKGLTAGLVMAVLEKETAKIA